MPTFLQPHRPLDRRRRPCAALCLALVTTLGLPPSAWARTTAQADLTELSLEQLMDVPVYGASRFQQKQSEAPASVTVITADDIRRHGWRTLGEILQSVRGFYVTYDRNYSFAGVRGFGRPGDYNSRILTLVDGHRINDAVYEMTPVGTDFPVDVELMDRVEVIRGPSSSLYGTSAFFAVVNIITKSASDLDRTELSASAGSQGTYRGRAAYGGELPGNLELLLSGSLYRSHGASVLHYPEFDDPATNYGDAEDVDSDAYRRAFGKLSFGDFTLEGAASWRRKQIPTGAYATRFNDSSNQTVDEHRYLDLRYQRGFGGDTQVMGRLFYDQYNYWGDYPYDYPPVTMYKEHGVARWWGAEAHLTRDLPWRNRLTAGGEYRRNGRQEQQNYDVDPHFEYASDSRQSDVWAVFAQDEVRILDNLILNAGVRYDHYTTFGGTTNPRAALIWEADANTVLKALYGQAFRAPNAYELYYSEDDDLEPEKIRTLELVAERRIGSHLTATVSGFASWVKDLIESDPDVFRNRGDVTSRGVEAELQGSTPFGLRGAVGYTWQVTRDTDSGHELTNSPRHLGKVGVVAPVWRDRVSLGVDTWYTGKRHTEAGDTVKAYWLTNATLLFERLLPGLDLSLSAYNLFGERYGDPVPPPPAYRQDDIQQGGRTFNATLTYGF